jgi:AcrR family transcriptional regulator
VTVTATVTSTATHPPRDDTRARILDVALELFGENGFAATSTRELSERLGFTKAALYYHFRTKDDLLAALVAPAVEQLATLATGTAPRHSSAARRELLAGYVDLVAKNETLIRVLSQDPSVAHRPALAPAQALYEQLTVRLAGNDPPDTAERVRVRAALGGIHAALLHPTENEDPAIVRDTALLAACGALGISAASSRASAR